MIKIAIMIYEPSHAFQSCKEGRFSHNICYFPSFLSFPPSIPCAVKANGYRFDITIIAINLVFFFSSHFHTGISNFTGCFN